MTVNKHSETLSIPQRPVAAPDPDITVSVTKLFNEPLVLQFGEEERWVKIDNTGELKKGRQPTYTTDLREAYYFSAMEQAVDALDKVPEGWHIRQIRIGLDTVNIEQWRRERYDEEVETLRRKYKQL